MKNKILQILQETEESAIIYAWNYFCENANRFDDMIESMDNFNDHFSNMEPVEIALRVYYGNDEGRNETSFNPNRNYFYFNGYGNPVSFDYIYNSYSKEFSAPVYIDELIEYMIENKEACFIDEVQELFDEVGDDE